MGFSGVKKRYPYPLRQRSCGAEAIINFGIVFIFEVTPRVKVQCLSSTHFPVLLVLLYPYISYLPRGLLLDEARRLSSALLRPLPPRLYDCPRRDLSKFCRQTTISKQGPFSTRAQTSPPTIVSIYIPLIYFVFLNSPTDMLEAGRVGMAIAQKEFITGMY